MYISYSCFTRAPIIVYIVHVHILLMRHPCSRNYVYSTCTYLTHASPAYHITFGLVYFYYQHKLLKASHIKVERSEVAWTTRVMLEGTCCSAFHKLQRPWKVSLAERSCRHFVLRYVEPKTILFRSNSVKPLMCSRTRRIDCFFLFDA